MEVQLQVKLIEYKAEKCKECGNTHKKKYEVKRTTSFAWINKLPSPLSTDFILKRVKEVFKNELKKDYGD